VADDALESALRALRHRDRTARELDQRLADRGFGVEERESALETLRRTGLLDDDRFARNRAETLASRGVGDELIRHDLEAAGVDAELADVALGAVEPELDRARRIVHARGPSPKTARYLRGRGYSYETVSAVVASAEASELP
jgi:regulatory protein